MEDISIKVKVEDAELVASLTKATALAEEAQTAIDGIGETAKTSLAKSTKAFNDEEKAIIEATRAANEHIRTIGRNNDETEKLVKQIDKEEKQLAKLVARYGRLDESSDKAKKLAVQMDGLTKSIARSNAKIDELDASSKKAGNGLQELASSGNAVAKSGFQKYLAGSLTGASRLTRGLKTLVTGGLRLLRGAIAATGLGALVLVVSSVVATFGKFESVTNLISDKINFLNGILKEFTDRMKGVADAVVGLFKGEKSLSDVGGALVNVVNSQGQSFLEAGRAAESYGQILRQIENEQKQFIVTEGKTLALIDERRRLAGDETKSISARSAAIRAAGNLEAELEAERIRFARANVDRIREANTVGDGALQFTEEQARAERELIDLQRSAADRQFSDQQALNALRAEAVQKSKEQADALKDLARQAQAVRDQLAALQNADAQGIEKIRFDAVNALKEIDNLESSLRELYAQRKVAFDLESEFAALRTVTAERASREIRNFQIEESRQQQEEAQRRLDAEQQAALQSIAQREELALVYAEIAQRSGLTEAEATLATERDKLNIQRQFALERLAIIEAQYGENSIEATLVRGQVELIRQQYDSLGNADLTGLARFKEKIIAAIGLDQATLQSIGGLFQQFGVSFSEAFTAIIDRQLTAQDALIEKTRERVDQVEEQLQREQGLYEEQAGLREQGLANDADRYAQSIVLLEEALAAEKAAQEKQEADRQALENKRLEAERKAANVRLAVDTAQQVSSYVTTILNLLAAESKLGIVGVLGVALGGLALVGSVVSKAKANAAQFKPQGFRFGTDYVTGAGTGTSDSIPARLSVGERVVPYELNQRLGGLTNQQIVKIVEQSKAQQQAAGNAERVRGVVSAYRSNAAEEARQERSEVMQAYKDAADRTANKMIAYWQTRPVTYHTEDGTVIEFNRGTEKVRQVVRAK